MLDALYFFFELLALAVAIIQFRKMKHTAYRYFVPYLVVIIIYEIGSIQNWFSINHSNLWITNFSMLFSFLFNSIFLLNLLKTPALKKRMTWVIMFSVFFFAVNMAFFQGFWKLDTATILLQYIIIIVLSFIYFYELMNYTVAQLSIISMPGFWLNTGLLFFCLINFLFFASFAYMAFKNNFQYFMLFRGIANLSIAILYSCLTIAFLCFGKASNRTLQL